MAERTDVEILADLATAKEKHHGKPTEATAARVKELTLELTTWITAGASPCPKCGVHPHGIRQPAYYEIGCLTDMNPKHPKQPLRAIGLSRKNAVDNWNEGEYYVKKQ
jgi:hypothetical protein